MVGNHTSEVAMHLNCPAEVAKYVGGTIRDALSDPTIAGRIGGNRLRIRLGLVDPDCVLYVDTVSREVRPATDGDAVDGFVAMAVDTALDCLMGRVDVAAAEARGEVVADVHARPFLDVLRATPGIAHLCGDVLRREGRADLLAAAS